MKIFIPSKDRAWSIRTHRLLQGAPYAVVVHDVEQSYRYQQNITLPAGRIYVSGLNKGLGAQRQWIWENLVKPGEWYLQVDDNLNNIYILAEPYYSQLSLPKPEKGFDNVIWRKRFRKPLSWPLMETYLNALIDEAEERGAYLIGFASMESPLFRDTKYRDYGFVNGKMMLIKKGPARWNPGLIVKSDYGFTAENLLKHGRVLITDYIYPDGDQGQIGGCGPLPKRAAKNIAAAARLMDLYPGLFKYKDRPGRAPMSEIVLACGSLRQFSAWKENALRPVGEKG